VNKTILLVALVAAMAAAAGLPARSALPPLPSGEDYFLVGKVGPGLDGTPGTVVGEDGRYYLVRISPDAALAAKAAGFMLKPLPAGPAAPRDLAPLSLPTGPDTTIERVVALVSQDSLARTILDLQAFGTRYSYRPTCESAAFYLRGRLADLGYTVRMDTYYLPSPRTRSFNVEATLAGAVVPESIVIACGHYDSYSTNFDDAPGANDDGTGTAAVIELARVLKQATYRWTVKFLCFSGEEQWMLGSGHWVDSTAVPQGLHIAGAYNLDMFGYTPYDTTMLYMTRNAASLELSVLAESANVWYGTGLNVVNFLDEDCAGDNAPFWDHGYRSVFACEDSEYGIWNGSDPAYHTPGDTFGYVRMGQVTRTTKLSAACIAALATPCTITGITEAGPVAPAPTAFAPFGRLPVEGLTLIAADGRTIANSRNAASLPPGVYFATEPGTGRVWKFIRLR
jgi:hypothetical protein